MFSKNKVSLIGRIGKDAETSFTQNNLAVTKFSVATTESVKRGEEYENIVMWHSCVVFGLNDFAKESLKKGANVGIEGKINYNEYEKDGIKKYFTQIIVDKFNGIIILEKSKVETTETTSSEDNSEQLPF